MKNKRAAMEMSVGTMVTIVLLMIVLVLGIFFIQRIFRTGTTAIDGIDAKIQNEIDNLFTNSNYLISGAIAHISGTEVYHKVEQTHEFEIGGWKMGNGLAHPNHKINIRY